MKYVRLIQEGDEYGSLPTWERGLKSWYVKERIADVMSLPTWERGLKLIILKITQWIFIVAPYMGAWIEISPVVTLN